MGVTGPSHATLFTSVEPPVHGVRRNGIALGPQRPVLAERLRDAGYRTGAFVSSFVVSARFGFDRGFDHFDDLFPETGETMGLDRWEGQAVEGGFDRRAAATTDSALAWAGGLGASAPAFLWVHYFDPHRPYRPPRDWGERFDPGDEAAPLERAIASYDAEIAYTDAELGRLLDGLRGTLGDDLLVIVTSDHGEGLMDHGWPTHGPTLYEEELRVPLVVSWKGVVSAGRVLSAPVALLDVVPTVVDLLGLDRRRLVTQGVSLAERITATGDGEPGRPVHAQRRHYETRRMQLRVAPGSPEQAVIEMDGDMLALRRGRWKLIEATAEGRLELYDLVDDPGETRNVASANAAAVAAMQEELAAWSARQAALAPEIAGELSPEDEERLRALGYMP
jgi:arylsulfatase A-like enzyme